MKSPLKPKPNLPKSKESVEARLMRMLAFDEDLRQSLPRNTILIGCDEVGRGSLIGSVVASAVAWKSSSVDSRTLLTGINDSKKLTAKQRQKLLPVIYEQCHVGIGQATPDEIARLNIIGASMLAVERAIEGLFAQADFPPSPLGKDPKSAVHYLMDGRDAIPAMAREQQSPIVKGDAQSALIAMASIVAKEHRDAWVQSVAVDFPHYAWATNMGYPTLEHREAITQWGITPHHRPSYRILN